MLSFGAVHQTGTSSICPIDLDFVFYIVYVYIAIANQTKSHKTFGTLGKRLDGLCEFNDYLFMDHYMAVKHGYVTGGQSSGPIKIQYSQVLLNFLKYSTCPIGDCWPTDWIDSKAWWEMDQVGYSCIMSVDTVKSNQSKRLDQQRDCFYACTHVCVVSVHIHIQVFELCSTKTNITVNK